MLFVLGFKVTNIFKHNTEDLSSLNVPLHGTRKVNYKISSYLSNIFTIDHNRYLVNVEILYFLYCKI
jgi:hypothetical protein